MAEPITTTIGLYSAIIGLAGGVVGASEKVISLRQKILPVPSEDGILVRVAESQFQDQQKSDAIQAVRQIYKTLASAHIHVERERRRQSVTSIIRLATRLTIIAAIAFGLPFFLQYLGYFSVIVLVIGAAIVAVLSFLVGQDAIKIDGLIMPGRIMNRISDIQGALGELSMNELARRARELATVVDKKADASFSGPMNEKSASVMTKKFLELYDELANSVNSVELYTLGAEFSTAANNMKLYLGSSINLVIVEAIEAMVTSGSLVPKPSADEENWLTKQEKSLAAEFQKLGVSHRLEHRDYQQLWSQDFATLLSKGDGKSSLMSQLSERRKGLILWQS